MSYQEPKRFMFHKKYTNKKSPLKHKPEVVPQSLNSYICSKCNQFYDFQLSSNNTYIGRVPLLLKCKHTLCEECILSSMLKDKLECVECNDITIFNEKYSKDTKLQDIFPVNFYVFGMVLYYRRSRVLKPSFTFRPVQTDKMINNSLEDETSMICCQLNCTNFVALKCFDSDYMLCETCLKLSHNSSAEVEHDMVDLKNFTPELQEKCLEHKSNVLEFACKQCDLKLCCYCVLNKHRDHDYHQLTQMNNEDLGKIEALLGEIENSLGYLRATDKKITSYLNRTSKDLDSKSNEIKTNLSIEISRHFENFHAKLQRIETNLHEQLEQHKTSKKKSLIITREKVQQNLTFLTKLSNCAKQLLNKEDVKYDVEFIIKNLMLALKVKCHLMQQEVDDHIKIDFGSAIHDIDDSYHFQRDQKNEFFLIHTQDLPEEYKLNDAISLDSISSQSTSLTNDDTIDEESIKNTSLGENDLSTSTKKSDITSKYAILKRDHSNSSSLSFSQKSRKSSVSSLESIDDQMSFNTKSLSMSCEKIPDLLAGNKEQVTVTHINSPSSFYVHFIKSRNTFNELTRVVSKYAKGTCIKVEPELNEIYLVKFSDPNHTKWYRGRITEIDKISDKYTVFFIDYGNTSVVSKKWIRYLPPKLMKFPPLAIHCKFSELYPLESFWNINALSLMADIVNNEILLMIIIKNSLDALEVDLITLDGTTSVREALIFSREAVPILNSNHLVLEAKKEMGISFKPKNDIIFPQGKFNQYESHKVIITHVESLSEIYLIMAESHRPFNDLKKEMNKTYLGAKKGFVYSMEVGMYVAVSIIEKESIVNWYRAKITQAPESRSTVIVKLIDVGVTVAIQWENIRKLNDTFYKTNALAFQVALIDVNNFTDDNTSTEKITKFFQRYVQKGIVLEMIVQENDVVPKIVLVETSDDTKFCVNGKLVAEDCAIGTGKYGYEISFKGEDQQNFTVEMMKMIQSSQSNDSSDSHDSTLDGYNNQTLQIEVEIVSVETPSLIYLKILQNERKFKELHAAMQACYDSSTAWPIEKWAPKQLVAVKYNGEYLRGIVREEVAENKYLVSLKDIRKDVEIEAKDMMMLYKNFTKCPELITRCHLANIIPAGGSEKWSAMACELLEETLKGKSKIYLIKVGKIDMNTRSLPVLLWYKQYFPGSALEESKTVMYSINKVLLKNGLALKTNTIKESLPSPEKIIRTDSIDKKFWDWPSPVLIQDDHIVAIPSCVNSSGQIYIHDVRDETALTEMSKKLLNYFKDTEVDNKLEDWKVGDICIAKYFLNEGWYRAKVVAINQNTVSVVMVDYGNEEDLNPIDLRKEILFDNVPIYASIVYLQDLNPLNDVWDKDDLDILHGAIVDKEIDVYFTKGHNIRNPSPVLMSFKGINVNDFMMTKCKHLQKSTVNETEINSFLTNSDCECDSDSPSVVLLPNDETDKESEKDEEIIKITREINTFEETLKKEFKNKEELINETNNEIKFKIENISNKSSFEIVIINLFDYNQIIFEQANYEHTNLEQFEAMEKDIQSNSQSLKPLENIILDAPCIVKYSQDNQYYRCKILGIRKDDVLVWFVDYGNFEYVLKSELKEIKMDWLDYPIQQHFAEIADVKFENAAKKEEFKEFLAKFYSEILLAEVAMREPLKVKLFDTKTRELIYQQFIN
ncbi:RING finger protein 17 [Onthophagus taurus]|uniref:RING finger protein 17 n=1 Tax=Onthophagus taurus TaxID=166361 RepID=UPI0039BE8EBC